METRNHTLVQDFFLLGFYGLHKFQIPIFLLLFILYSATLSANCLIIALVSTTHQLHSPMYTFLGHLSLTDIFIASNVAPKALQVVLSGGSSISSRGCIMQMYLFGVFAIMECCLLTVMSYDRYLAICNPLHYNSIMKLKLPNVLVLYSWVAGFTVNITSYVLVEELQFCGPNVIDHFFCDLAPLLKLSCSDTSKAHVGVSVVATAMGLFQFIFIIVTYICIFGNILQISTTIGRKKAFSTCSSHLSVVCVYYGTLLTLYVAPARGYSLNMNKFLSLLNTVVTPVFNPIIYSLRNKEIQKAMKKHTFTKMQYLM